MDFWERSVNIGDVEYKKKYILGLIPCLLYQVEYDWKVGAWAGRKKVKDTWGLVVLKGGKLGDAVVGMEELWERIIVS